MKENKGDDRTKYTNALIHASSPYLLQHAHNPVNWFPWSEEALQKAKEQNKPLIISIGYAACHWCHVMEHESYSNGEVAAYMNEHFVSVKVDREERPDIDQVYMKASMLLSGSGGWPLNAFALPDGRPFYVLTYLPQKQWLELLHEIIKVYREQPDDVQAQAEAITRGIRGKGWIRKPVNDAQQAMEDIYQSLWDKIAASIDRVNGGLGGAPKFPMPNAWELLLQYHYFTGHEKALEAVMLTLNQMARGGIYDQLGGGFARYATDAHWRIPHFEKMLYDNAQLVSLYSHAYQVTRHPLYENVIRDTLSFIGREMTDQSGGFYASLNADSEGEEGKVYVWTENEINDLLPEGIAVVVKDYYQIMPEGNWEHGKNILYKRMSDEAFAEKRCMSLKSLQHILQQAHAILLKERSTRIRPTTDTKILTSWNALMVKGFVDAYRAFGEPAYLSAAIKGARFLEQNMMQKGGALWRNYRLGRASIPGLLDDYAFLAEAFMALYQVTFDLDWLNRAEELAVFALAHFYDPDSGLFFYTSDDSESLIARQKETEDNVLPASNSVMAHVLYRLGVFLDNDVYKERSAEMLAQVAEQIPAAVPYFSHWAQLLGLTMKGPDEVVIMGKDALARSGEMQKSFLPAALFMGGEKEDLPLLKERSVEGETLIYVCKNKMCRLPVEDARDALKQIR